jgi:hypothetical protein
MCVIVLFLHVITLRVVFMLDGFKMIYVIFYASWEFLSKIRKIKR